MRQALVGSTLWKVRILIWWWSFGPACTRRAVEEVKLSVSAVASQIHLILTAGLGLNTCQKQHLTSHFFFSPRFTRWDLAKGNLRPHQCSWWGGRWWRGGKKSSHFYSWIFKKWALGWRQLATSDGSAGGAPMSLVPPLPPSESWVGDVGNY